MARSLVHPEHLFAPWQVWPGSYDNPQADGNFPRPAECGFRIDRQTPMASMGSCFAREIKSYLLNKGYRYLCEEQENPAAVHASAAWERTYNTFSMRQIFDYTFASFSPRLRWWPLADGERVQDPYRRVILYRSREEAEADFVLHCQASRRVLQTARVLILTLGLTEIWEDREDGSVIALPGGPYANQGGDMSRYRFRVSRFQENLENLEHIHGLLRQHNPSCQLVVTVSPVHLWATFRRDLDVISASCNSKSTLRAVADEFVAGHEQVHYFPAYEMATIYRGLLGKSYLAQGRENFHVNKETVKCIMANFLKFYHPVSA
ncbi:GSCFA domain-containing protein [Desulfogranum mediterraneum]|uniref:GSCFA domain-containing protein n=1 Tax=Desulfogranum mediterraneum TaxID=160661 RepID=UPI00048E005C|nr:GSCFA domain-containing protein [Desulfogranum mediterraneum]